MSFVDWWIFVDLWVLQDWWILEVLRGFKDFVDLRVLQVNDFSWPLKNSWWLMKFVDLCWAWQGWWTVNLRALIKEQILRSNSIKFYKSMTLMNLKTLKGCKNSYFWCSSRLTGLMNFRGLKSFVELNKVDCVE